MAKFNNLFGVVFAATIFVLLVQSNAEGVSQPEANYADFIGLHSRLNVKRIVTTNVNGTMLYTLGARIAGESHYTDSDYHMNLKWNFVRR